MLKMPSIGLFAMSTILAARLVSAECMTIGYEKGSRIPIYVVQSMESLSNEWHSYAEKHPDTARLSDSQHHFRPRALNEQCLVSFSLEDERMQSERLVIQQPCSSFSVGDRMRLIIWIYCVENFGRNPDFYSTLPYKHAHVATDTHY
jgi:hypothetical protein